MLAKEDDEPGKLPKTLLQLFLPVDDDTAPRAADHGRGSESEEKEKIRAVTLEGDITRKEETRVIFQ